MEKNCIVLMTKVPDGKYRCESVTTYRLEGNDKPRVVRVPFIICTDGKPVEPPQDSNYPEYGIEHTLMTEEQATAIHASLTRMFSQEGYEYTIFKAV